VFEYREIITYNGENISKEDYATCVEKVKTAVETLPEKNQPTAFELETAVAFVYFNLKNCDYVVMECGMGGRQDATNVTDSVLAVLTSISLDHSAFLGNTVEEIAREKAAIIKNSAVSAMQVESVEKVITEVCHDVIFADYSKIKNTSYSLEKTVFDYGDIKDIEIGLFGRQQTENASLAIEAAKKLGISEKSIKQGLKNAVWHGRFEVISKNPLIIADGAHNPDAALRLRENVELYLNKPVNIVMGMFKDKEYKKVADIMTHLAKEIYTVSPKGERGLASNILADYIKSTGKSATPCESIHQALEKAVGDNPVLVFGSLSILKEVYTEVKNGKIQ
jgi:dihydrofolate synthase/folylpolyglutamate synthase